MNHIDFTMDFIYRGHLRLPAAVPLACSTDSGVITCCCCFIFLPAAATSPWLLPPPSSRCHHLLTDEGSIFLIHCSCSSPSYALAAFTPFRVYSLRYCTDHIVTARVFYLADVTDELKSSSSADRLEKQ
ncbi:hypothetical protein Taro_022903 [Colocasia esculenta]|uniref:Uncharacterized protein n=1 Tax=Colocasia esculenta TaxID=4460 RepID=A0A843V9A0_COLES|nr:hypothetical protein [Colocasia esculenta]